MKYTIKMGNESVWNGSILSLYLKERSIQKCIKGLKTVENIDPGIA